MNIYVWQMDALGGWAGDEIGFFISGHLIAIGNTVDEARRNAADRDIVYLQHDSLGGAPTWKCPDGRVRRTILREIEKEPIGIFNVDQTIGFLGGD